jgi:hypothetical protein
MAPVPADDVPGAGSDPSAEIAALRDEAAELSARCDRLQWHLDYLRHRSLAERLLFSFDGRPCWPLRRLLFHKNGKPRGMFRRTIVRPDGLPHPMLQLWMTGEAYRALPKALRLSLTAPVPAGSAGGRGRVEALSPRAEQMLRRLRALHDRSGRSA